jgi:hypothetical protein
MGRSQVLFNQKHGRPGSKGRGPGRGRGRGADHHNNNKHQHQTVEGDNAWRYKQEEQESTAELLDQRVLALEEQGNYSNQASLLETHEGGWSSATSSINLDELKKSLDALPLSYLLGLPSYLTEPCDSRKPQRAAALTPEPLKTLNPLSEMAEVDPRSIRSPEVDQQLDGDDEDDMESWLDSVIS